MRRQAMVTVTITILLLLANGCVTDVDIVREGDFDREEALAVHREAYEPVYQFILDFYPLEGPRVDRFKTRADVVDYLSGVLPEDVAGSIAAAFLGDEPDAFNVAYDVLFPTPLHSGVLLADAYIERVEWPKLGRVDHYLVVVDRFVEELASLGDRHRETRYVQNDAGAWEIHSISGFMVVRGAMYSPYGLRN